jgi:thiopurine S-methyltransferase
MDADFWLSRWRDGRTGWHQAAPSPALTKYWRALKLPPGSRVLVPLAGKSLDLCWLADHDFRVLGIELSPLAVSQFFADHQLTPHIEQAHGYARYSTANIDIIQSDIFKVDPSAFAECAALYDRAALVALPAPERQRYARHVYANMPPGSQGLLITFEYPPGQMEGPPFSVDEAQVQTLFARHWEINQLTRRDILADEPSFQARGVTALATAVYQLTRRAG